MLDKISSSRKYYIAPFTDEDIKKFLRKRYHYNLKKFKRAWKIVEKNKNLSVRPLLLRFMDELLEEEYSFEYDFQLYEYLFDKWIERERRNINEELGKNLYEECLIMAKKIYSQWQKSGKIGVYLNDIKTDMSFDGIEAIQLKGHALINRTSDGMYKFSHKSYWEFLLAKLAISDFMFADELLIKNFDRATAFLEEMIQYNKTNLDQSSPSFYVGVANYYLKYGKPECAEEQLKMVINSYSENRTLHLYAHIKLAESYWHQIKYESAKKELNMLYSSVFNSEISIKNVDLYKEDVLQAFRWILQNRERYKLRIVNISVGTTYRTRNEQDVLVQGVEKLWDEGLVVVAAAGNQGPKPGSVTAPGCSKKIITVGSSDMLSGKRAVSGRGPTFECVCKPDLVAPGRQIMACTPGAGNLYSMKSGTSMSTPLVSGAIALALEKDSLLSNVEIKMMLRDSCDDMGLPRNQQGWGKFNCKKFLAL